MIEMRPSVLFAAAVMVLFCQLGCSGPPVPPEVAKAEGQFSDLRGAGAWEFFPSEYELYLSLTEAAKQRFFKIRARPAWFRNYDRTADEFRNVLSEGDVLRALLHSFKEKEREDAFSRISGLKKQVSKLRRIGGMIQDERSPLPRLAQVDFLTAESENFIENEFFGKGRARLALAEQMLEEVKRSLYDVLVRYNDSARLRIWRLWIDETITDSRKESRAAVIITKIDRRLILYRNGRSVRTFSVSFGRNALFDKLHAGDFATPEGRYKVIKKLPNSQFHRALLLDYPNQVDRRIFVQNRRGGRIPSGAGIGGLIEIHGGGSDIMTEGCISMNNEDIDFLYNLLEAGSSVTIVGSLSSLDAILEDPDGK